MRIDIIEKDIHVFSGRTIIYWPERFISFLIFSAVFHKTVFCINRSSYTLLETDPWADTSHPADFHP